jgi:cyclohexanone monooxygenase
VNRITVLVIFFEKKIRETVKDPKVAEALCPDKDFLLWSHRVSVEDNYYETFNLPNVTLLDVKHSVISFDENNILIDSKPYPIDILILATGFIPVLGSLLKIDIRGKEGIPLIKKWENITENFIGLMVPNFPNFFMIHGPGSPNILSNMIALSQVHSDLISDLLQYMKNNNHRFIEPLQASADKWVEYTSAIMNLSVFSSKRNNYNTNVKGEQGYIHSFLTPFYTSKIQEIEKSNFSDFVFS